MSKAQIGLVGCFQNGKSTLVNCLLNNRVALTGEGVAKTKKIVRYVYGREPIFRRVDRDGAVCELDKEAIRELVLSQENDDVAFCEMALPSPLLEDVDFIDTPGFDANQEDTTQTTDYFDKLDFVFFVVGGGGNRGNLNEAEKSVLREILARKKPFAVLYNCCDGTAWEPNCEKVRRCVDSLDAVLLNAGVRPFKTTENGGILPVNLAWYWRSLVDRKLDASFRFFDETRAETRLMKQVKSYFYDPDEPNDGVPTPERLAELANIDLVKRYVVAISPFIAAIPEPELTCEEDGATVRASWRLCENENANYSYELRYRLKDDDAWSCVETHETARKIENLKIGRTYEFQVRAVDPQLQRTSAFCDAAKVKIRGAVQGGGRGTGGGMFGGLKSKEE